MMEPLFFLNAEEFRGWLENNHHLDTELWVGFFNKKSGKSAEFNYPAAVETALCYGWIDGLTKSVNPDCFMVRFTKRKKRSHWSDINIRRVELLKEAGLMHPAGLAAFENRPASEDKFTPEKTASGLPDFMEEKIREVPRAWNYFLHSSDSYKRITVGWIMSAKQESTRMKRLTILTDSSLQGMKIPLLRQSKD
jgi:uncharacterized protein YdeI (YjbR/CyaY-like superfamily)